MVHIEEEAMGTRLLIGSATILLCKESDPSRLVASSPGKLVRHLVAPGSRVQINTPYAELEVSRGWGFAELSVTLYSSIC